MVNVTVVVLVGRATEFFDYLSRPPEGLVDDDGNTMVIYHWIEIDWNVTQARKQYRKNVKSRGILDER